MKITYYSKRKIQQSRILQIKEQRRPFRTKQSGENLNGSQRYQIIRSNNSEIAMVGNTLHNSDESKNNERNLRLIFVGLQLKQEKHKGRHGCKTSCTISSAIHVTSQRCESISFLILLIFFLK